MRRQRRLVPVRGGVDGVLVGHSRRIKKTENRDAGKKTASSTSGCRRPSIVNALPSTVGRVQARCDAHSASANNASTSPTNRAAFRKGARKVPATFEHSRRISADAA